MVNDAIEKIKNAEKEAERIAEIAAEEARHIIERSGVEAAKIRVQSEATMKAERELMLKEAEEAGKKEYDRIIAEAAHAARELEAKANFANAVDLIRKKVFASYGNR